MQPPGLLEEPFLMVYFLAFNLEIVKLTLVNFKGLLWGWYSEIKDWVSVIVYKLGLSLKYDVA